MSSGSGTGSSSRIRQVEAIDHGTVVDHIPSDRTLQVARLLQQPGDQMFVGVNLRSNALGAKGVVKIRGRELSQHTISCLALIAPSATMSIIRDYQVVAKSRIPVPERFTGVARCPNPNCITNHEAVTTRFAVVDRQPVRVRCAYCERTFAASELDVLGAAR